MLTRHSSVFQIISRKCKHLTNRKVQEGKVFWHVIVVVICATLCVSFSSKSKATSVIPKRILKSKARNQSIQARKKLLCQVEVKNYLHSVLRRFLIKTKSTWRREIKEQTPQLNFLCSDMTVENSYRRSSI